MNDPNIIELNVGGTMFATTYETLCKLEYFKNLLRPENCKNLIKDKNGYIFLDRDPQIFGILLRNLRRKNFHVLQLRSNVKPYAIEIDQELENYNIKIK
jgi:hypothetical protein